MRLSEFSNKQDITEANILSRAVQSIVSATGLDTVMSDRLLKKEIQRVVDEWQNYYSGLPTNLRQNLTMDQIQDFFNSVGYGRSGAEIVGKMITEPQTQSEPTLGAGDIVSYTLPNGTENTATIVDISGSGDNIRLSLEAEDGTRYVADKDRIEQYNVRKVGSDVTEAKANPKDETVLAVVQRMKNIIPTIVTTAIEKNPKIWTNIANYHSKKSDGQRSSVGQSSSETVSRQERSVIQPIARKLSRLDDRDFGNLGLNDEEIDVLKKFLQNQAR